jgi:hypothetical protein
MNIYNENFFDFFDQGDGTERSFYTNYKKLSYIPNLSSDAFVPPPLHGLSEPSAILTEPLVEYRVKQNGSLDAGDIALIIVAIIIIAFLAYYFWNQWKEIQDEENIQLKEYKF